MFKYKEHLKHHDLEHLHELHGPLFFLTGKTLFSEMTGKNGCQWPENFRSNFPRGNNDLHVFIIPVNPCCHAAPAFSHALGPRNYNGGCSGCP
jgi:hypothetical protein